MNRMLYAVGSLLTAWNDATLKVEDDLSKLSFQELGDRFEACNTGMEAIETKYEDSDVSNFSAEDTTAYQNLLNVQNATLAAQNVLPESLQRQRQVNNVVPQAAGLSSTLSSLSNRIVVGADNSVHDPKAGFSDDRDFLSAVTNMYCGREMDNRLAAHVQNAVGDDEYSRGDWKSGGVLIPKGFLNRLITSPIEADQLLGKMTTVPMEVPKLDIPALVDKNHSTSFTGGTQVYRTSETRTAANTKDQFEQISMEATELVGQSAATKMLIKYSPLSIPALISSSLRTAVEYKQREEIITGDGKGKYLGFLNAANGALTTLTRGPGAVPNADIIRGVDIIRMRQRVFGFDQAVWVFNWDLFEHIAQLHVESPNNAGIIKLYAPPTGDVPETLLGRPIVWTEFMPGIQDGQDGSVVTEWGESAFSNVFAACVNMSNYYHGQLYTEENHSVHVRFEEREEVFQWVLSDDARPSWLTSLTPKRGITQRSPFVGLLNTDVS